MGIDVKNTLLEGERATLECKKAAKCVPGSVWNTYSAFANTNGGIILLGVAEHMDVKDNSGRFEIAGVEDADKIRKDFWNTINSSEKVNVNLLHDEDVQTVEVYGKKVVAINVPRADYTVRPVYINNNLSRGTFKRTNPGLLKLPLAQIYKGGESKARNQRMQNMFRMIGFGENLGSGFPLILDAWNEKHWLRPELLEQPELLQVKLTLYIQNEPINEPVNERQQALLQIIEQNASVTREELSERLSISLATLKRDLALLRKNGYVARRGSDKAGQWILLKKK